MLPTLSIKSTIKTFKSHAIEIKHLTGEMGLNKISHKYSKCKKYIKMHHMELSLKKLILTNSSPTKPKNKSSKSFSKEVNYKSQINKDRFNNLILQLILSKLLLKNVSIPQLKEDSHLIT